MASKRSPNSTETLPDGTLVEFWDEVGVDGEPQRRRYAVNGGRSTSISSVAKALDTDPTGLMYWAASLTCEGVSWLSEAHPDQAWIGSGKSIERALRDNELTWRHVRDQTAKRGTNVHELIFATLGAGKQTPSLADLSEDERGYGQAAIRWWRDHKPEPVYVEQMTADADAGVAGRFDLLADIDGERVLVDAKTREKGRARIGDHVQLAGYERCNRRCEIGSSERQLALLLLPDGTYREVWGQAVGEDFDAALTAIRAGRQLEARMRKAEKAAQVKHDTEAQIANAVEAVA
jgi:hypothetical protein